MTKGNESRFNNFKGKIMISITCGNPVLELNVKLSNLIAAKQIVLHCYMKPNSITLCNDSAKMIDEKDFPEKVEVIF